MVADRTLEARPAWSQTLGEVPQDPTRRARWQRQLAVVAAYGDQYKVTDNSTAQPAGPYLEDGRTGHHAYWQATEAAITARRGPPSRNRTDLLYQNLMTGRSLGECGATG